MSATQATVTSTQLAVRYRRNVGSLSIDMSTDTRPIYRSRCVSQHSDRHIGRDTVNSRYSGHSRDRVLVSVIAGCEKIFTFKLYLQEGVTRVFIFIKSGTFSDPLLHVKSIRTLFTNRTELNKTDISQKTYIIWV